MALNLWKIGKQPTSYNPLPTGWNNYVDTSIGEYLVRFNAKSLSFATLRLGANDGTMLNINNTGSTGYNFTLTPESKSYSIPMTGKGANRLFFVDVNNKGDVIIDSIELIQKPLPKLTLNGVDGFTSGKWTLHANAVVVDDTSFYVIQPSSGANDTTLFVPVLSNTIYTFSFSGTGLVWMELQNSLGALTTVVCNNKPKGVYTFTSGNSDTRIRIVFFGGASSGTYTYSNPMLNLGSTPAPYSRKTGDKMVLPVVKSRNLFDGQIEVGSYTSGTGVKTTGTGITRSINFIPVVGGRTVYLSKKDSNSLSLNTRIFQYDASKAYIRDDVAVNITLQPNTSFITFHVGNNALSVSDLVQLEEGTSATAYTPYDVQASKKAKKYVPKKNMLNGLQSGTINSDGAEVISTTRLKTWISVIKGKSYTISVPSGFKMYVRFFDSKTSLQTGVNDWTTGVATFTPNCYFLGILFSKIDDSTISVADAPVGLQLEEGSTATSYEPYTLITPKARTGLAFNGVSDYLQLPSMTMDSVEIECLIESYTGNSWEYIIDARNGLTNGYVVFNTGSLYGGSAFTITGVVRNQRTKIKAVSSVPFTDDVTIFAGNPTLNPRYPVRGTIYKVTCYLGGQVVAQYDFENASNIVGSTVLQSGNNLIPNFEDARWSLHANTQVLGKHLLRLNATGSGQWSYVDIPVVVGQRYFVPKMTVTNNPVCNLYTVDNSNVTNFISGMVVSDVNYVIPANIKALRIYLYSNVAGTFEYSKPQLYALSGAEGTLNGTPQSARKLSRRTQYAKR